MQNDAEKEAALNDILFEAYNRSLGQGFDGTFEFYKKVHAGGLREIMGLKKDSAVEKELTEEEKSEKIFSAYNESVVAGYKGDFNSWKEKYPNIVSFVSRPVKIAEEKVKPKATIQYKTNWDEVQASGFKGTMEDFRKQFPQITLTIPKAPLTEDEKFEEESKKIYEGLKKNNPDSTITLETVKETLKKEKQEDPDSALRRKAISNVSLSISGSGSVPSQPLREKMIQEELEYLKKQKRLNWQAYERLLSGDEK